jgi:uncharacterized protein with von Willebrand factor type A (vWA) domain
MEYDKKRGSTSLLTIIPNAMIKNEKLNDYSQMEILFLIDKSGSMKQDYKIDLAKTAMITFLKSLPEGIKFNLFEFDHLYKSCFDESSIYSKENLSKSLEFIKEINANGGTSILIFNLKKFMSYLKKFFSKEKKIFFYKLFLLQTVRLTRRKQI